MSRVNNYFIGQRHDLFTQAFEQHTCKIFFSDASLLDGQVRAAYITQEEGIARKDGVVFSLLVT